MSRREKERTRDCSRMREMDATRCIRLQRSSEYTYLGTTMCQRSHLSHGSCSYEYIVRQPPSRHRSNFFVPDGYSTGTNQAKPLRTRTGTISTITSCIKSCGFLVRFAVCTALRAVRLSYCFVVYTA